MSEDLLLWLVVVGFTLAAWLAERVKAAKARGRRPAAVPPAVSMRLPIATPVPVPEAPPPLPRPVALPQPARPPRLAMPGARSRLRLNPRRAREGMVLAAILGPCKGLE